VDDVARFSGRTLVVLGAGYVGEGVCRGGLARGMQVFALTRNPERAAALGACGVRVVVADLAENGWHAQVPATADYVLNCVSSGGGGVNGYRRSYVEGGRSVLNWAQAGGARGALIYTSSTSVYSQGEGALVDESTSTEGAGETGQILLEAEALAQAWPGARAVLRLAGIYGPGRHLLLDHLRAGSRVLSGKGEHRLNLIHRDDIEGAIWSVWRTATPPGEGLLFNLADDTPTAKADVAAWLAECLGVEPPTFSDLPTSGRRGVVPDRVILNSRIKSRTGWTPRYPSFREGYAPLLGA